MIKPRTYISPSAFKIWETCQYQFYHYYLAGHTHVQRGTSRAAGIGTVFDAILKDFLNKTLDVNDPRLELEELTKYIVWEDDVDVEEVWEVAQQVAAGYIKNGFHKIFLEAKNVLLDREIYRIKNDIPILGILDALVDGVPFDFKLRGFNSKASPVKGFHKRYDSNGNKLKPHADSVFPSNMEKANRDWALQMLWYNWLVENMYTPTKPYEYIIHEIVWNGYDWHFCEHVGTITKEFNDEILKGLSNMWFDIGELNCEIEQPTPSTYKCEKFGTVCSTAEFCNEYQRTLGNPEYRMLFT